MNLYRALERFKLLVTCVVHKNPTCRVEVIPPVLQLEHEVWESNLAWLTLGVSASTLSYCCPCSAVLPLELSARGEGRGLQAHPGTCRDSQNCPSSSHPAAAGLGSLHLLRDSAGGNSWGLAGFQQLPLCHPHPWVLICGSSNQVGLWENWRLPLHNCFSTLIQISSFLRFKKGMVDRREGKPL